jgi:hypothetical protein
MQRFRFLLLATIVATCPFAAARPGGGARSI